LRKDRASNTKAKANSTNSSSSNSSSNERYGNGTGQEHNRHVPYFLRGIAEKILTTGKYLNVVRECGNSRSSSNNNNNINNSNSSTSTHKMGSQRSTEQRIAFSDESHAYDGIVSRAHDFASRSLLVLLLKVLNLCHFSVGL